MDIILCYSSGDRIFADRLVNDLAGADLKLAVTRWELRSSQHITNRIQNIRTDRDRLVIILSPNSLQQEWIKVDLNASGMRRLVEEGIEVIRVWYGLKEAPGHPSPAQANFGDGKQYTRGLDELLNVLRQKPKLVPRYHPTYVLSIGISTYNCIRSLTRAATDARDFHDLLIAQGCVQNKISLLVDAQATKPAISSKLDWLARRARPEDTTVIFFSGHGAQLVGGFRPGEYLCPVEAAFDRVEETLISTAEFTAALRAIRAGRLVVFLDACHAGGVGEPKDAGEQVKTGLSDFAYSQLGEGQGRVIIASCRPEESSWELDGMRNGLFTHYLLNGLRGEAARPDRTVWVNDLFSYVYRQVSQHDVHYSQHPFQKAAAEDFVITIAVSITNRSSEQQKTTPPHTPCLDGMENRPDELIALLDKHLTSDDLIRLCMRFKNKMPEEIDARGRVHQIGTLVSDLARYRPSRISELIAWINEHRHDLCDQGSPASGHLRPATIQRNGNGTMVSDVAQDGILRYGSNHLPGDHHQRSVSMDTQTTIQLAALGAWLWTFIAPGAKGFVEGVGKGLGETFAKLGWGVIEKAHKTDRQQAEQIDRSPVANKDLARSLVIRVLQDNPSEAQLLFREVVPALQKLLKDPSFFADPDIRDELVPGVGYSAERLAGPNAATARLANRLVEQAVADGKLEKLLDEIQELKPRLFV